MNFRNNGLFIFSFIFIASLILIYFFYLNFPDQVAVHFNVYGEADNFYGKKSFLIIAGVILIFSGLVFILVTKMFERISPRWLGIPNRYYWFAPERKENTIWGLKNYLYIFGAVTILYLDFVFYEIYQANQLAEPHLSSGSYISLIIYILVSTFLVIKFYKDFRIKDEE